MTTTKDLLSLPSLSHMKLLGGARGLTRAVTWPYVILCPPIDEWVSGGEFLIYYGANTVVEKVELQQLVREAAQNDAAGILFLVGRHYILEENLDDELRQLADELAIPVFSHTSLAYVNSITKDIIGLIQERDKKQATANAFWYSLFFNQADTDQLSTLDKALFLGYLPNYTYCVYILQLMNADEYFQNLETVHGASFMETRSEFYRMLATKLDYMTRKETDLGWHIARNNSNIFVFPVNTERQEEATSSFLISACSRLEAQYPGTVFCIGQGSRRSQLSGIRDSFILAQRCLMAYNLIGKGKKLISCPDLGFYELLFEIPHAARPKEYAARFLDPILDYDRENKSQLFETLCTYLDCRFNKVQTAKALFLHRNTLLGRLDKIEKLLHASLEDTETLFQLQTAVHIHRFLQET